MAVAIVERVDNDRIWPLQKQVCSSERLMFDIIEISTVKDADAP